MRDFQKRSKDALTGFAVGDALGVPVEFETRDGLKRNPVRGMLEYMHHNQPAGTWSDDSSLVFCTAESLCNGYSLDDIALHFSRWKNNRFWTPHGRVFDIGISTSKAIERIDRFIEMGIRMKPIPEHEANQFENGNGSLMRILPLAFYLADKPMDEQFIVIRDVSALTHAHIRSVIGCFIYVQFVIGLLNGMNKTEAYAEMQLGVSDFLKDRVSRDELFLYSRILKNMISEYPEASIHSTTYVLHTLEAVLWCTMRYTTFSETVLSAVNLGHDTDTIGALTGGLAGLIYGADKIPKEWIDQLARKEDIFILAKRFGETPWQKL